MAGILHVIQHFKGTEIEELAKKIYLAAEWDWFLQANGAVSAGWAPEKGIFGEYKGYNEYVLVYLLGLGSPTHTIPATSWDVWSSGDGFQWIQPYKNIGAFLSPDGKMTPLAYGNKRIKSEPQAMQRLGNEERISARSLGLDCL